MTRSVILASICLSLSAQYTITTIAGGGIPDGVLAVGVSLASPDVALDTAGNMYISSFYGARVYKVDTFGILTTVAGNGIQGFTGDGGPATSASINHPEGVAVDRNGNVYIADSYNNVIRKVSNGIITTIAGNGSAGVSGSNVLATSTSLNYPLGIAVDNSGNIFIGEFYNNKVSKVSGGIITAVAGNGTQGYNGDNIAATSAELNLPRRIALDSSGNLYIADTGNYRIREVISGTIKTIAGTGSPCSNGGFVPPCGDSNDGIAPTSASLNVPAGVAVDTSGNVYVAVENENRVREFANVPGGTISTIAGTGGGGAFSGDGGIATLAMLNQPLSLAVGSGGLYIGDAANNRVRLVRNGIITTAAGGGTTGDGGAATNALIASPYGVALDAANNVYVAEAGGSRIREVVNGIIATVAGNGIDGYSGPNFGDGSLATSVPLNLPDGVAVDSLGNFYIVDTYNGSIREVKDGIITTVAGSPVTGSLNFPAAVAVDGSGNLYIADSHNHRIAKVSGGVLTTFAGNGTPGYTGDGVPATSTSLNYPQAVALDAKGNLFIADYTNNRIGR